LKIDWNGGPTPAGTARRLRLKAQAVPAESIPGMEINFYWNVKIAFFLVWKNAILAFVLASLIFYYLYIYWN